MGAPSKPVLLTRDQFREGVFARDGHRCVICGEPAQDAHHILERRLFSDGGYYLDNGASVCGPHHIECERTTISVEQVREAAGIRRAILPEHLYADTIYDKWGNPILPNGQRTKGELFYDLSVQKVLADGGVLHLFTNRVKYNRTFHVPWSPGLHDDDRMLSSLAPFIGKRVVVTEKMDGENTTCYADGYVHARSVDSGGHPTRDWVKGFWSGIAHDLPEDWRVCGENLFEKHSIGYDALPSYFMGFSIWNDRNACLSWGETMEWFALLGITPVPVLYDGIFDQKAIEALYDEKADYERREGYVMRVAESFVYGQFRSHVGKFVRRDHVRTVPHNRLRRNDFQKNGLA